MEQTSVILRGVVESDCPLLLFNNPLQIVDIGAGGHFCGKGGDVALQQLARLENFKRADVAAEQLLLFAVVLVGNAHDIHPGSLTNIHRPLQLQHQQRLAHDGPADAIGFGNMAFRRQTRPDGVMPLRDLGAQVIRQSPGTASFPADTIAFSTKSPVFSVTCLRVKYAAILCKYFPR